MKKKYVVLFLILGLITISSFAQTRSVTNSELEKYRQKRVQAEKDLNENYEKMGFSSPEERNRRLEAWKKENQELTDRWARERIAQETADALAAQAAATARLNQTVQSSYQRYNPNEIWGYGGGFVGDGLGFNNRFGFHNRFFNPFVQRGGYFAGGAFWPGPSPVGFPRFRGGQTPHVSPHPVSGGTMRGH